MLPIIRLCDSCRFYNESSNTCKAFPEGIPLRSQDTHFEVIEGQVGDHIYDMDKDLYDEFDAFMRVNPGTKMPIFITYDVPEEGEYVEQEDVELEEVEDE